MFAGKLLISRVSLQVVQETYCTTNDELLPDNSDVSINQRHLQFVATEVFKSGNNFNSHFMWDHFN